MINLPACVFDIITVNGLTNLIANPIHFSGNSETLIDLILVTDIIHVIDCDTIPIDRSISDHDGTYATIHSGYVSLSLIAVRKFESNQILSSSLIIIFCDGIHNLQMPMKVTVKCVHAVLISVAL
jgi:hypothetical protein